MLGSSRTDAGVSAFGNTCHVDMTRCDKHGNIKEPCAPHTLLRGVNFFFQKANDQVCAIDLADDDPHNAVGSTGPRAMDNRNLLLMRRCQIEIVDARRVRPDFHCRHAATGRTYRFVFTTLTWFSGIACMTFVRLWFVPAEMDSNYTSVDTTLLRTITLTLDWHLTGYPIQEVFSTLILLGSCRPDLGAQIQQGLRSTQRFGNSKGPTGDTIEAIVLWCGMIMWSRHRCVDTQSLTLHDRL